MNPSNLVNHIWKPCTKHALFDFCNHCSGKGFEPVEVENEMEYEILKEGKNLVGYKHQVGVAFAYAYNGFKWCEVPVDSKTPVIRKFLPIRVGGGSMFVVPL